MRRAPMRRHTACACPRRCAHPRECRGHTPAPDGPLWCGRAVHETARPVVVAFDGSDAARAAVTAAADLFRDRPLIVVSVWEAGLAAAAVQPTATDPWVPGYAMVSPEDIITVDRIQRDAAAATAEAGAELAREHGATAEPVAVPEEGDIPGAVLRVADERDAGALVVGSRGLGATRAKLFGSTSQRLLHDARRPVVVVHRPDR